jgi:N6-L-threonylcarbamoyladenine synthase
MDEVRMVLAGRTPVAVAVSERPRNIDGSYMPCFLTGLMAAQSISATLGIPLFKFSHQCGHIAAALYGSENLSLIGESFCAFHVSGGTTDILTVSPAENGFFALRVGGSDDLHAGQAIDRIGVAMGLSFPAGREMEELAVQNTECFTKRKPKCRDMKISLSGLENLAMKLYRETKNKELVSAFTLDYIYEGLSALAHAYIEKYGHKKIVFSGGVMSNSIIKEKLSQKYDAAFAPPALSADNAVGIAVLGALKIK